MIKLIDILIENEVNNIRVEIASKFDKSKIIDTFVLCFPQYNTNDMKQYVLEVANFDKSYVLTDDYDNLYGIYLVGDRQLHQVIDEENLIPTENIDGYKSKLGIEGVALGVVPEKRNKGYSNLLKKSIKSSASEYDYIFGLQFKSLQNINHWIKSRRIVAENDELFLTLEDL